MAGPFSRSGAGGTRAVVLVAVVWVCAGAGGCSFVPRSKLDECHRLSQTLRADNTRLKDVTAELRSQNQELTQRAVDDARRLTAQEEAVERLEKSVTAYQTERDQLAAAFEAIKRQVRLAASPQPSAALDHQPLRDFAAPRAGEGWTFDPASGTLSVAADGLFAPGSTRLEARGEVALKALAKSLADAIPDGQTLEVVGLPGSTAIDPAVQKAGFSAEAGDPVGDAAPTGRFLAAARAARVRETLLEAARLDPGRVRLAPAPEEAPAPTAPAGSQTADPGRRIALRLVAPGLDEARPRDR